jgi:hypothetical protein
VTSELVTRMLYVHQIVDYFNRGVSVSICDRADTKLVYEVLTNHLTAWKHKLDTTLNNRDAPLEDLVAMDKCAHAVYQHAQWEYTGVFEESLLARSIKGIVRYNRETILPRKPKITQVNAEPDDPENQEPAVGPGGKRVSMGDVFASRQAASRAKWS